MSAQDRPSTQRHNFLFKYMIIRLSREWGNDDEANPILVFGYFITGNIARQSRRNINGF